MRVYQCSQHRRLAYKGWFQIRFSVMNGLDEYDRLSNRLPTIRVIPNGIPTNCTHMLGMLRVLEDISIANKLSTGCIDNCAVISIIVHLIHNTCIYCKLTGVSQAIKVKDPGVNCIVNNYSCTQPRHMNGTNAFLLPELYSPFHFHLHNADIKFYNYKKYSDIAHGHGCVYRITISFRVFGDSVHCSFSTQWFLLAL